MNREFRDRLNWFGGILDGEGSITFCLARHVTVRGAKFQFLPMVNVSNTDETIIKEVSDILSQLEVRYYVQLKQARPKHAPCWQVSLMGMKQVGKLLERVTPFLVGKRLRAEVLLRAIKHRQKTLDVRARFGPRRSVVGDKWLMKQLRELRPNMEVPSEAHANLP